jgi:hypothetical protein
MGLGLPTPTYLEGPGGPVPIDQVEWVEIATSRVRGGLAGKPIEVLDATEEIIAALGATKAVWSFRETSWSLPIAHFGERPLRAIHLGNPFLRVDG